MRDAIAEIRVLILFGLMTEAEASRLIERLEEGTSWRSS
jgi:hypothetical protein